jgi:DNA-binding transcriptional MocR family regulator
MKKKMIGQNDDFLYRQLSERIAVQIQRFTLKTGDKLPSLRAFSKEQGVSLSTSYKAYADLEMNGLIEARPKSGYFVRYTPVRKLGSAKMNTRLYAKRGANPNELIVMVQQNFARADMIKLSLATPDISLLPQAKLNKSMVEAMKTSSSSCMLYEDIQGFLDLRKHIARQAINWGGNISQEDIVTTQGCMEALVYCLKAITKPGDLIAIESPTYFGIFNVIESLGLRMIEIPANPATGVNLDYLKKTLAENKISACLFAPTFSNPMGYCMSNDHKKDLVKLLLRFGVPLIEDDIYGEMYFGKARPKTCKSFDQDGMVLLCSSVSKSLAPGYRVGWCMPGKFKEEIIKLKLIGTVSSATPTQHAIAHFFETGRYDLHMRNLRKKLYAQCLRYTQAIAEYFPEETKVSRPEGGYVLWIELSKNINAFDVFYEASEARISIAPGQLFSIDRRFSNYIRISFGTPYSKVMDDCISLLGKIIKKLLTTNIQKRMGS